MSTLKKIAKDLDLSVSTVSRILNRKAKAYRISDKTVKSVLKYAEEIGYSPNMIAKGLQASQTFTIGLMVPNIANSFFALLAKNIEKCASMANYSIILVDSDESVAKERKQLLNMMGRKVDGIIVASVGDSFHHFTEIAKQKIPLILVDRYFENAAIPYITSDNYQGSYEATQELILNGHKRISLISGSSGNELVKGILISLLAGIAMGFFYRYVAQSMSFDFVTPEVGKLTPYTALVVFSFGILLSNFIFNSINMYKPITGDPVTYKDYFTLGNPRLHFIGILGGAIWGVGMSFSIIASEQAGPAIAYGLGQGATMVAALWGVFIWKELKELPQSKNWLISAMFLCFVVGLSLIIYSKVA